MAEKYLKVFRKMCVVTSAVAFVGVLYYGDYDRATILLILFALLTRKED